MKVLMIAPQPFLEPRGTPISVYQRLHGLSSLGHKVDLVTYHVGKDIDIRGVTHHRIPSIPFITTVRIGPSWVKIPLDIVLFLYSVWMMLKNRYDVIHSHEEAAFFAVVISKLFRTPHLYDMHSSLPKQLKNFRFCNYPLVIKIFETLELWVLRTCDVVLTIGVDLEEYVLLTNSRANHIRIENIPVHTNADHDSDQVARLAQSLGLDGRLPIVYTGTFERYQGLDLLFESVRNVVRSFPDVAFVIVGGQPKQITHWKNEVERLGLKDSVIFTGTVSLSDSLLYLELAEILVSPRTEGLSVPLKIYSYLRSGKPMVVTDIFAHTQILSDETAVIVDLDPDAYAEGILRLIEDVDLRVRIGSQARTHAEEEYSEKNYLAKLEKAYLAIRYSKRIDEIVPKRRSGERSYRFP
jgi:glycosyltransferase involved in cell wall biosynthesis